MKRKYYRWAVLEFQGDKQTYLAMADGKSAAMYSMAERIALVSKDEAVKAYKEFFENQGILHWIFRHGIMEPNYHLSSNGAVYNWRAVRLSPIIIRNEKDTDSE